MKQPGEEERARATTENKKNAVMHAERYIERKLRSSRASMWPTVESSRAAASSYRRVIHSDHTKRLKSDPVDVWGWMDKYLDKSQKKTMYSALRSKSSREDNRNLGHVVSLTVSGEEFVELEKLAEKQGIKGSGRRGDVIKANLHKILKPVAL
ncbi:MAG: hypothetical protein R8K20_02300 [Gallionellaceae bacterium]